MQSEELDGSNSETNEAPNDEPPIIEEPPIIDEEAPTIDPSNLNHSNNRTDSNSVDIEEINLEDLRDDF